MAAKWKRVAALSLFLAVVPGSGPAQPPRTALESLAIDHEPFREGEATRSRAVFGIWVGLANEQAVAQAKVPMTTMAGANVIFLPTSSVASSLPAPRNSRSSGVGMIL